jgi:hypothetical protein
MGKYSNAFFSEITHMIKAKLYMSVHWMVLIQGTFLLSLVPIGTVVSEKKLEM